MRKVFNITLAVAVETENEDYDVTNIYYTAKDLSNEAQVEILEQVEAVEI